LNLSSDSLLDDDYDVLQYLCHKIYACVFSAGPNLKL
jgi:hypothetical protein